MPKKLVRKCCICKKPVFSIKSKYCRVCSHFSARMSDERFPPKTRGELWSDGAAPEIGTGQDKGQMKKILVLIILIYFVPALFGAADGQTLGSKPKENPWYKLFDKEEYITDFNLNAGASRSITIDSNKEIMVGFRSNVAPEVFEAYVRQNMQIPVEEDKAPLVLTTPIEQDAQGQTSASIYGFGGGTTFQPGNGKIVLLMLNHSKEAYKILIYKKTK